MLESHFTLKILTEMSFFFLAASGFNLATSLFLGVRIYLDFKSSEEGSFLSYYRDRTGSIFSGENKSACYENFAHLITLHLFIPLTGFAFFLKSDANFLVFIVSVLWSIQLFQRLYPGTAAES